MALTNWVFLYCAPGLPPQGHVETVSSAACTTTLAGFPGTDAALDACRAALAERLREAQLVELCGAFSSAHLQQLRPLLPAGVPIGLVTYTGDMVAALHRLFS